MKWKRGDTTDDWADWTPIPLEPKEDYYAELNYCRENNISYQNYAITRLRYQPGVYDGMKEKVRKLIHTS